MTTPTAEEIEEIRKDVGNPPWCYDDSDQQFPYLPVEHGQILLSALDAVTAERDKLSESLQVIGKWIADCPIGVLPCDFASDGSSMSVGRLFVAAKDGGT